jgi:pimeloyl-ACP methyl ester carboxylesterase
MYTPKYVSRSEWLTVRGHAFHVRHWGREGAPKLWMLHGWMDASPTFQFVVDALERDWHVIAPDWRGFGLTAWNSGSYYFPDYLAVQHPQLGRAFAPPVAHMKGMAAHGQPFRT